MISEALKPTGACRSALSRVIATSAKLRAGRVAVPEKMTSSMPEARMFLCELSPITQRSASSRLDLPQPFGPTTPVRPSSISISAGSTKDLNPVSRSRVNFMPRPRSRHRYAPRRGSRPNRASARRPDQLAELIDRMLAAELLAVDEEGRRRLHPIGVCSLVADRHDSLGEVLVLQALVEAVLADAGELGDLGKLGAGVLAGPDFLLLEQHVDHREVFFRRGAAGQHEGGERQVVEGELAEDELHLAGVNELALELRKDVLVKGGAVRAGGRGIFDDGDRRVGAAQHLVAEGRRVEQGGQIGRRRLGTRDARESACDLVATEQPGGKTTGCHQTATKDQQLSTSEYHDGRYLPIFHPFASPCSPSLPSASRRRSSGTLLRRALRLRRSPVSSRRAGGPTGSSTSVSSARIFSRSTT